MQDSTIWTEKFRPKNFKEIIGQDRIVARISSFVKSKNIPHLLLSGPAGTGKSTISLVIAKELFGSNWRQSFLELNASDTRGIDTIRNEVKDFCRTRSIGNVPFKLIFLDESDALTREAQQSLRRLMEQYAHNTRFILSCVTPNTKILLPEEIEITIKDYFNHFEEKKISNISNINNSLENKQDQVLACVNLNPKTINKRVLEITTMTGRKLELTEDHRLLTKRGWVNAKDLQKEDKLLIYPHLEGTYFEDRDERIIDLKKFIDFLSAKEEEKGYKNLSNADSFRELKTIEKKRVIRRIKQLYKEIKEDKGLTGRGYQIYQIIKNSGKIISRKEIQDKIGLSRIRIVQFLKELEQKGHIKRIIGKNKHTHSFKITETKPKILRNFAHIRQIIKKEFKIKISYSGTCKCLNKTLQRGNADRALGELKRKELLDIAYNDQKIGAFSRITAFLMGDGHLTKENGIMIFSGNNKALKEAKKDLRILGYEASQIQTKEIHNERKGRKFIGKTTWCRLTSRALSLLFQYLGVPTGDKASTSYRVPDFVKNGTKFVKREFLRSFFGCEGDKLSWYKGNHFEAIRLCQNKIKDLEKDEIDYLNDIRELLKEFGVKSYIKVYEVKERRKKDNKEVLSFLLHLKSSNKNLFNFLSRVGYYYEQYKVESSKIASEYLRHKQFTINLQKQKALQVINYIEQGKKNFEIIKQVNCTHDFIRDRKRGKEVKLAYSQFPWFEDWKKDYNYKNGFVWNEIHEIKEIDNQEVMDVTCSEDHNFITNGFVSHNCNYSSKIIDPIQSRCAVFHFRPIEKEFV
ncbi:MAG: AAA family ATPase, partial [Nanoarchaeota archaeon]|nr:AAA family ATPase [Nanoarchaeota archaeon]